ncbi:MAG: ABC transporter ATP-binding protein [Lachnospiraceae bacterium]|nr:ABC transporter ATP-binding protein [Lachnospiraceae bacterium]
MEIIKAQNIERSFRLASGEKLDVLRNISVSVPENTLAILKGPSGSGKTTLMNIMGGLDAPDGGTMIFDGKDIYSRSDTDIDELRRREFGFVFQSVSLIPIMTVYENVEFSLRLSDFKGNREERVMRCLSLVGLEARADHMPQELSGGEQQRVAIARAIAHSPRVIFADEPTAELDSQTAIHVVSLFKELVEKENVTIVMTTHDVSLMSAGDIVYSIENGVLVTDEERTV